MEKRRGTRIDPWDAPNFILKFLEKVLQGWYISVSVHLTVEWEMMETDIYANNAANKLMNESLLV